MEDGGRLIPAAATSQEIATSGARSSWAYALKPLYDYDLRQLVRRRPPLGKSGAKQGRC